MHIFWSYFPFDYLDDGGKMEFCSMNDLPPTRWFCHSQFCANWAVYCLYMTTPGKKLCLNNANLLLSHGVQLVAFLLHAIKHGFCGDSVIIEVSTRFLAVESLLFLVIWVGPSVKNLNHELADIGNILSWYQMARSRPLIYQLTFHSHTWFFHIAWISCKLAICQHLRAFAILNLSWLGIWVIDVLLIGWCCQCIWLFLYGNLSGLLWPLLFTDDFSEYSMPLDFVFG